jgi:hypothetical protein
MAGLVRQWEQPKSRFGDLVVIGFLLMQCLDAVFTYLGVALWGPSIEANPLISSAMSAAGSSGLSGWQKASRLASASCSTCAGCTPWSPF